MTDPGSLVLHGYHYSVYNRIARLALAEKELACERVEVNPFDPDRPAAYLTLHPFGRVPVLVHDGFALYESGAITRYLDRAFPGPHLQPTEPRALARMDQIIGVVDSYGYWPMVRQVFSHGFFRPRRGLTGDPAEVTRGLEGSARVLAALEGAGRERCLSRRTRPVTRRPASRRDGRLLHGRPRRRCDAEEPRATFRLVGALLAAHEPEADRSGFVRQSTTDHSPRASMP